MSIRESTISIQSRWGLPAIHLFEARPNPSGLVVIFPGSNYPAHAPLLRYARRAALENGFDVLSLEYGFQANRAEMRREDISTLAEEAVEALNAVSLDYPVIVFVSKSLGGLVASRVQQHLSLTVPIRHHIFLTPLAGTIDAMRHTNHAMAVVGTRDPLFGPDEVALVAELPHVELHAVPDANHALEVENYHESLRILQDVTQWCAEFLRNSQ